MNLLSLSRHGVGSALVLLAVLAVSPTASAQGSESDATRLHEAEARFQDGIKAFDKGNFERAHVVFLEAQAIYPRPSLLRNLALCELRLKHPLEALQHLQAYLGDPRTTPEGRSDAQKNFDEAYALTGHVSVTAADGAHIKVDGKEVGIAPLKAPVDVLVGIHGVDAESGGAVLHERVEAGEGKLTEVTFVGAVVGSGKVVGTPGGPPVVIVSPPEEHPKYWNTRRTVGVVIAGVGVVGLVVGGVFGGEVGSQTSDANAAAATIGPSSSGCVNPTSATVTTACSNLTNAQNARVSDSHVEESMLIGGAMLVAVGVVTVLWPNASPPPTAGLAPMVGPRLAGLQWSTSF